MAKAKDLVIVESPSKAKTIEKYLGPNYRVTASMGHLRDLPKRPVLFILPPTLTAKVRRFPGI